MRTFTTIVFGGVTAVVISLISPYNLTDWQFWMADLCILISGILHALVCARAEALD